MMTDDIGNAALFFASDEACGESVGRLVTGLAMNAANRNDRKTTVADVLTIRDSAEPVSCSRTQHQKAGVLDLLGVAANSSRTAVIRHRSTAQRKDRRVPIYRNDRDERRLHDTLRWVCWVVSSSGSSSLANRSG